MSELQIDVWSDIACPWCFVGKRKLEAALAKFEHKDDVQVRWRAFELNPSAEKEIDLGQGSYIERLANKYRKPVAEAERMVANMTDAGAELGIDFRFDRVRPGNTFDAHRLIHAAHKVDLGSEMKERLLRAYMTDGALVSDPPTLIRLGEEVGLDGESVKRMLETEEHSGAVRSDEAAAREIGCTGVPFFVFASEYAVPGAQPAETLLKVLRTVWDERHPVLETAEVCTPSGCA